MSRPIEPGCLVMVKTSTLGNAGRTGRVVQWIEAGDSFEINPGVLVITDRGGWLVDAARTFRVQCECAVTGAPYLIEAARCDFPAERLLRLDGDADDDFGMQREAREEGVPA
jgi:hypothetical protein